MSVRRLDPIQPDTFAFTAENRRWADRELKKYPEGKQASAVIALLWRAQRQAGGWLPEPAIRCVAEILDMAYIRVYEVVTFYTMFNLSPVGEFYVQLCGTTPCWLRGAEDLKDVCRREIGEPDTISPDGRMSWIEVECLGACVNAPMVQINDDYYEDLTGDSFQALLNDLREDRKVHPGPQINRQNSCPIGGATTLAQVAKARDGKAPQKPVSDKSKPHILKRPRKGGADHLQRILGIGPRIEDLLNELGVFHYDQIAGWDDDNLAWVNQYLRFKGRIERENWIEQAAALAAENE